MRFPILRVNLSYVDLSRDCTRGAGKVDDSPACHCRSAACQSLCTAPPQRAHAAAGSPADPESARVRACCQVHCTGQIVDSGQGGKHIQGVATGRCCSHQAQLRHALAGGRQGRLPSGSRYQPEKGG